MTELASTSLDLKGQVALVTGAAGALGSMAARTFARAGAKLVLVDLDPVRLNACAQSLRDETGGDVLACPASVTDPEAMAAVVAQAVTAFGSVSILLNNAGVGSAKTLMESTPDDWRRVYEVNVIGTVVPTQACAPVMMKQRYGRIVNVSSVTARTSVPQRCAYGATKAAVSNLTQSFAVELGPHGINVNAIAPSAVVTDMNRELLVTQPHIYRDLMEHTPVGRMCEANDLAGVLTLLASPAAGFITAQTIFIDGGFTVM